MCLGSWIRSVLCSIHFQVYRFTSPFSGDLLYDDIQYVLRTWILALPEVTGLAVSCFGVNIVSFLRVSKDADHQGFLYTGPLHDEPFVIQSKGIGVMCVGMSSNVPGSALLCVAERT